MTYRLGDLLSKDADFTYGYGSKGTDEFYFWGDINHD